MNLSVASKLVVISLLFGFSSPIFGQANDEQAKTELGLRQRLVQIKMQEVEKQFQLIATRLEKENPEQAKLLTDAYQRSKEQLITAKMEAITELLNQNKLEEARKLQVEVREGLNDLVRLLTQQKEPKLNKQQEIDQLNQWKNEIQKQLERQKQQTSETRKVSNKEKTLQKLEAQIEQLNELAKKQQELLDKTKNSDKAPLRELDKIADQQFEIRKQTEDLKKQISENGKAEENNESQGKVGPKPGDSEPSNSGKPNLASDSPANSGEPGGKTGEQPEDNGDKKSAEEQGKGNKAKGNKAKGNKAKGNKDAGDPSKGQPKEAAEPKEKSEGEAGESSDESSGMSQDGKQGKSGDGSNSNGGESSPPQPGEKELEESQQAQAAAEEKLGSAKPEDAAASQQEALDKMNEALDKLEKEKRRIESLPPEVLDRMAEDQRRLRDKAMEMAKKMDESPKGKDDGDQQSNDQQQPGQQSMEQAGQAQQQAADAMQNQDSEEAAEQQEQAQQKMQQAIDEIEERLAQLKDETREEKLARLEARFKEMLDRQKAASAVTIEIDDKRSVLKKLQTRDQLLMLRLANDETELNESAQQAYDLLLEDGTSFVFPEVVADLQEQLVNAANLLSNEKTGSYTQLVQQEIESTISDLIDALKQAQNAGSSSGGGGGGGGADQGEQPLLKKSAELKVLRIQQLRLNRRTQKIDQLKSQADIDPAMILNEQKSAAEFQSKLIEMTDQILEKSSQ